jgi:antitoxin YefM
VTFSADQWEAIDETLEILQDEETLRALRESADDVEAGRLFSLDQIKRELGLR